MIKLRLAATALALLAAAACAAGPAEEPTPSAEPSASATGLTDASTTRQVHDALIIPGSNVLFAAESDAPATDESWASVRDGANKVIQGAELLKTGSRPDGRTDWIAAAETVIAATKVTAEALAQNNAEDLVFTNGDMMTGCTSCHQQFRTTPPA
jgi:hypothetical protein